MISKHLVSMSPWQTKIVIQITIILLWKDRNVDLNIYSKQIYNYFHNTTSTWIGGGGIIVNHFVLSGIEGRNYVIMSKV